MRNQRGTSYFAILFAIMGFAFIAKVVIAVWGPYWDDRVVDSQIEELLVASPANIESSKFLSQLGQRLDMNNVREFNVKENIKVINGAGLQVKKDYEVQKNFMMNIDLLMKFEKDFDQSAVKAK